MLSSADRNAIEGLFDRLAEAERKSGPRDAEAEAFIRQKMAEQPGSAYYLAQTVVVQQEALKEAERRIEALEGSGGRSVSRQRDPWGRRDAYDDRRAPPSQGGGFLAGAAQTALGVAGGVMLGSLLGSLFGIGGANAAESDSGDNGGSDSDAGSDDGFGGDGGDFGGGDFGGGDF